MKMRDILLFSQYSVIFAKSKTHDFDVSHEKLYWNDIIFSLKFPLAFFCRLLYHNREHNWINCLRGGVKFPTDSIVWMREGVYGIFVMLFFDACTLGDNRFQGCYTIEKELFS